MLNFVCNFDGWVLEKVARRLAAFTGGKVSEIPDDNARANIFMPYYLYQPTRGMNIAVFTHRESGRHDIQLRKAKTFDAVAAISDWNIAMSNKTAGLLPSEKTTVIEFPIDESMPKEKVKIGVCGIEQPFDRKRWTWLHGISHIPGVELHVTNGGVPDEQMPAWYDSIDYLLVLGDNEGGPMPVKEAVARCKPVIAPNVGWAWEYPVIQYDTEQQLHTIIRRLVPRSGLAEAGNRLLALIEIIDRGRKDGGHCIKQEATVHEGQAAG